MRNRFEEAYPRRTGNAVPAHTLSALACAAVMALGLAAGTAAHAANAAPADTGAPRQTATISALSISGNSVFSNSQLRHAMGINPAGWFSRGDDYSKARLATALSSLRSFYISRGYLRFTVKAVTTAPSPDGKTVAISLVVVEGPLYKLASIQFSDDPASLASTPGVTEALQRALPIDQPVTREGLDAARRAIIAQLGHEGYPQASVSSRFTADDANARIALMFEVTRGRLSAQTSPVRKGGVATVTSTPATPPAAAASAAPAAKSPAAPPNTAATAKPPPAQPPQTPPAQTAQPQTPPAQTPPQTPGQPEKAGEKLDMKEEREISLGASVGYSSADRAIAVASARYINGLGKGHDLAADIAGGKSYRAVRLSETDRWFTPGGVSRSTSLWYHSDQPFRYLNGSHFRTSSVGATERFDIPVTAADSFYVAPGGEHDWLGLDSLTPQVYQSHVNRVGSTLNVVTLRGGWTHDMRDSASLPTRGYIAQGDAEIGVGNAYYLKAYASARYYHPLWGSTVLSLSGLGGFGQGFGSKGYPIQKYFYAGGVNSVRGYAGNGIGPRDPGTGYPIGGRRLLVGSIEAITPITSFKSDIPGRPVWLLFADGGNVWNSGLNGTGSGPVRFSYGAGLGWQIPFGTLKLSFALPVTRHRGDDYQRFQVEFNAGF